jgi:hypothetical protein
MFSMITAALWAFNFFVKMCFYLVLAKFAPMKKVCSITLCRFLYSLILLIPFQGYSQKSILSITPGSGTPGRSIDIVIRGINTNFRDGQSIADFGAGITVKRFIVSNSETAIAAIEITASATSGFRKVKITTGAETVELDNAFEVFTAGGNFRASLEVLPFQSGSLSDFDISNPSGQPILFFINLYNDNVSRLIKVTMTFYKENGAELFKLYTDQLSISSMQLMRLTNRDFNNFKISKPDGSHFFRDITDKATIPPGEYIYKLTVTDENGNILGEDQTKTVFTNPVNNPELIMPGADFSTPVPEIYNAYPLFQWFGQNDRYDFALFEVLPGQSPEEVVRNIRVYHQEDIIGNNLLYPMSAEKLVAGKTYAWQIWGKIPTSKGIQLLPASVFRFRYMGITKDGGDKVNISRIVVTPQKMDMTTGTEFRFTAVVYDQDNKPVVTVKPMWKLVPVKGSITSDGLFKAGDTGGTLAVVAQLGDIQDYATVVVKEPKVVPKENTDDWMINQMLKELFGLPK